MEGSGIRGEGSGARGQGLDFPGRSLIVTSSVVVILGVTVIPSEAKDLFFAAVFTQILRFARNDPRAQNDPWVALGLSQLS